MQATETVSEIYEDASGGCAVYAQEGNPIFIRNVFTQKNPICGRKLIPFLFGNKNVHRSGSAAGASRRIKDAADQGHDNHPLPQLPEVDDRRRRPRRRPSRRRLGRGGGGRRAAHRPEDAPALRVLRREDRARRNGHPRSIYDS